MLPKSLALSLFPAQRTVGSMQKKSWDTRKVKGASTAQHKHILHAAPKGF